MDAKWEVFATHLHVERNMREGIYSLHLGNVTHCFSEVTDRWLSGGEGTGDLPRMNVIPAEESGRTYNSPVKPPHLAHNQGKRHNHILFLCPLCLLSLICCSSVDLERDPTLTEDRLVSLVL